MLPFNSMFVNKLYDYSLLTLFSLLLSSCQAPHEIDWELLDDSVIRLYQDSGMGTAFAINDQGYYVTNEHVIDGADGKLKAVKSISPILKTYPARVIWSSKEKDLALVHVPDWQNPALVLGASDTVKKKQAVITIGFPGASDLGMLNDEYSEPKIKSGVISARQTISRTRDGQLHLFEHDAVINAGNSGGPLVDECGRVVGVNELVAASKARVNSNKLELDIKQGTFFSVQIDELKNILRQENIEFLEDNSICNPNSIFIANVAGLSIPVWGGIMAILLLLTYFGLQRRLQKGFVNQRDFSKLIRKKIKQFDNQQEEIPRIGIHRNDKGEIVNSDKTPSASKKSYVLIPGQSNWPEIALSTGDKITLGRDPNKVDLEFSLDDISRRHAAIRVNQQGELQVIDLGSTYGTFLDHEQVGSHSWRIMQPGERLIIASEKIVYRIKIEPGNV
jgi:Trypsin-like peptidase domain/FHA domain